MSYAVEETGLLAQQNCHTIISQCYNLSLTARCMAIANILGTILFAINYTYYIFAVVFSIFGYIASTFYIYRLLLFIDYYLILLNIVRSTILIYLFFDQTPSDRKENQVIFVVGGALFLFELWYLHIIRRCRKLLKKLSAEEKAYIRTITDCETGTFICW